VERAFVFSHGGRHGAWSWKLVLEELEARGYEAVAIDLPVEEQDAGAARCAEVVAEAARPLAGAVTVVGHSVSGLVIPLVPALTPVEELAFVCTPLPVPGVSLWDQLEGGPNRDVLLREALQPMLTAQDEGNPVGIAEAHALHTYYHDVPDELARWAVSQLRPPLPVLTKEPSPLQRWPEVRMRYVLGRNDRIVNPDWARREVPRLLGVTPIELDTGHSPFLARPAALVDALLAPLPSSRDVTASAA
jgi:pimeloyl-ACP methyl ester carboxylesterase